MKITRRTLPMLLHGGTVLVLLLIILTIKITTYHSRLISWTSNNSATIQQTYSISLEYPKIMSNFEDMHYKRSSFTQGPLKSIPNKTTTTSVKSFCLTEAVLQYVILKYGSLARAGIGPLCWVSSSFSESFFQLQEHFIQEPYEVATARYRNFKSQ